MRKVTIDKTSHQRFINQVKSKWSQWCQLVKVRNVKKQLILLKTLLYTVKRFDKDLDLTNSYSKRSSDINTAVGLSSSS